MTTGDIDCLIHSVEYEIGQQGTPDKVHSSNGKFVVVDMAANALNENVTAAVPRATIELQLGTEVEPSTISMPGELKMGRLNSESSTSGYIVFCVPNGTEHFSLESVAPNGSTVARKSFLVR